MQPTTKAEVISSRYCCLEIGAVFGQHGRMDQISPRLDPVKFRHPDITAKGETRARVALRSLDTLWFNTGTLCNLTCANCYIESSPRNDRLAWLSRAEVARYLDEIAERKLPTRLIGFTGGEPFMNADLPGMLQDA